MEKNKAYFIAVGAEPVEVVPANGRNFSYEELKGFIGGTLTIVPLPSKRVLVADDNGKLTGLEKNEAATDLWKEEYPIKEYPGNNDELIVGPVLIAPRKMVR